MTPAVKRAIEALRKAQRHLGSYSAPPERVEYLAEALAGLEAEAAAELRRPAAAEVEEAIAELRSLDYEDDQDVIARAIALLRRLSPSPTEEEWRPIEDEPPKDGRIVYLADPNHGLQRGWWCGGTAKLYRQNKWWMLGGHGLELHPTHWRPLPAPPSLPTDKT